MDEWLMERYSLAKGRIWEICTEKTIKEPFAGFFRRTAEFLKKTGEILEREEDSLSLAEYEAENRSLYEELFPQNYGTSYGNPAYAEKMLGDY